MKYKICLVADVPNWSFDYIAKKVQKELSNQYDIRIAYFNRRKDADYLYEFIEKNDDCDLIHFLNRRILLLMGTEVFKNKVEASGKKVKDYIAEKKRKFSTSVNDHIDLDPKGIQTLMPIYNEYVKMYYTSNQKLFDIYSSINEFKKPEAMLHDLCDGEIFKPIHLERLKYNNINNRIITIGWVGNSIHSDQGESDLKGFHTIIKPVIQELQHEGYHIKGYYADRNEKWRLREEMPQYYSEIDVCLCTSMHEGTPLPILEAMYCGIPIISTDVGIVNEALGKKQKDFVIGDRQGGKNDRQIQRRLKEKIIQLYNNRQLFQELSEENLNSINKFYNGKIIEGYKNFFDKCLRS